MPFAQRKQACSDAGLPCHMLQAGPPYELDPYTLETKAGGPSNLNGWVQAGKAPQHHRLLHP